MLLQKCITDCSGLWAGLAGCVKSSFCGFCCKALGLGFLCISAASYSDASASIVTRCAMLFGIQTAQLR